MNKKRPVTSLAQYEQVLRQRHPFRCLPLVMAASMARVLGLLDWQEFNPAKRRRKLGHWWMAHLLDRGDEQTDQVPPVDQSAHHYPKNQHQRTRGEIHHKVEDQAECPREALATERCNILTRAHDEAVETRPDKRHLLEQEQEDDGDNHPEQEVRPLSLHEFNEQLSALFTFHDNLLQVSSAKSFSGTKQYSRFKLKCQDLSLNPYTKKPSPSPPPGPIKSSQTAPSPVHIPANNAVPPAESSPAFETARATDDPQAPAIAISPRQKQQLHPAPARQYRSRRLEHNNCSIK